MKIIIKDLYNIFLIYCNDNKHSYHHWLLANSEMRIAIGLAYDWQRKIRWTNYMNNQFTKCLYLLFLTKHKKTHYNHLYNNSTIEATLSVCFAIFKKRKEYFIGNNEIMKKILS